MTLKRICKLLDDPHRQVNVMLAVTAIEEATKGLPTMDKNIAVSLWMNGITSFEQLTDMFIEEAIKDDASSKKD